MRYLSVVLACCGFFVSVMAQEARLQKLYADFSDRIHPLVETFAQHVSVEEMQAYLTVLCEKTGDPVLQGLIKQTGFWKQDITVPMKTIITDFCAEFSAAADFSGIPTNQKNVRAICLFSFSLLVYRFLYNCLIVRGITPCHFRSSVALKSPDAFDAEIMGKLRDAAANKKIIS
jgi:hypothetical protein